MPPERLTLRQAAKYVGCSFTSMVRREAEGCFEVFRMTPTSRKEITKESLIRWMSKCTEQPTIYGKSK